MNLHSFYKNSDHYNFIKVVEYYTLGETKIYLLEDHLDLKQVNMVFVVLFNFTNIKAFHFLPLHGWFASFLFLLLNDSILEGRINELKYYKQEVIIVSISLCKCG